MRGLALPIIAGVPLIVCLLFSGAIHIIWRRRREAPHASLWSLAFAVVAAGWALDLLGLCFVGVPPVPGAGPGLCWLAAALLLVQGLRKRAKRSDRGTILVAIWATIAIATALLADLFTGQPFVQQTGAPLLVAIGLTLAAVAVGPRLHEAQLPDWIAFGLLLGIALANLVLDFLWIVNGTGFMGGTLPLVSSLLYVGCGLAAMLLLSEDMAIALERLARTDPLTGVWNRRAFNEAAPHLLDRLRNSNGPILAAVAISDIDAFKSINDRFGHATGDEVLISFARLLESAVGQRDLLARLGGEEFALLAIGVSGAVLYERVDHLRQTIGLKSDDNGALPTITASFGVAEISASTLDLRDALERADRALFRAKALGRNRAVLDQAAVPPEAHSEPAPQGA